MQSVLSDLDIKSRGCLLMKTSMCLIYSASGRPMARGHVLMGHGYGKQSEQSSTNATCRSILVFRSGNAISNLLNRIGSFWYHISSKKISYPYISMV